MFLVLTVMLLVFGYDKEVISFLPYRFIEKPFFQFYLNITPSDAIWTDALAFLLSVILGIRSMIYFIKKEDKRIRYLFFVIIFIMVGISSLFILFTRNNYYSVQLVNSNDEKIKFIDFDGVRKLKSLKPNEGKWIIYKSNYPNKRDNTGETWRRINYTNNNSRQGIDVFTEDAMKTIKIPDDNDNPGGIRRL